MYKVALERFQKTRQGTLGVLDGLSQVQLDARPAGDKWSPGEVLDHLLLNDEFILNDCKKLVELARTGQPATIRHTFADVDVAPAYVAKAILPFMTIPFTVVSRVTPPAVRDFLVRTRVFAVQHPEFATPWPKRLKFELYGDLQKTISEFESLYAQNADLDLRKMSTSHPLLGKNNMIQILDFANAHEQRHQSQVCDAVALWSGQQPCHSGQP